MISEDCHQYRYATSCAWSPAKGSHRFPLQLAALFVVSSVLAVLGRSGIWRGLRGEVSSEDDAADAVLVTALRSQVLELQEELRLARQGRRLLETVDSNLADHLLLLSDNATAGEAKPSGDGHSAATTSAEASEGHSSPESVASADAHGAAESGAEASEGHSAAESGASAEAHGAAESAEAHGGHSSDSGAEGHSSDSADGHHHEPHEGTDAHGHLIDPHGGHHEKIDNVTLTIAYMLFGFLLTNMVFLYLVNYPDENIRKATFQMTSTTISIFCAVLLNQAIFGFFFEQLIPSPFPRGLGLGEPGPEAKLAVGLACLLFWWTALNVIIWRNKEDRMKTFAYQSIVGHLTAFAAIQTLGNLQQTELISKSLAATIVSAAIVAPLLFVILRILSFYLRKTCLKTMKEDGYRPFDGSGSQSVATSEAEDAHKNHWVEECVEGEDEAAALCNSFLFMQVIVQLCVGAIMPLEGDHSVHDEHELQNMAYWCLGMLVLVIAFSIARAKNIIFCCQDSDVDDETHIVPRMISTSHQMVNLTFCWCTWRLASWISRRCFQNTAMAKVVTAAIVTVVSVITLIILDMFADKLKKEHEEEKKGKTLVPSSTMAFCCGFGGSSPKSSERDSSNNKNKVVDVQQLLSVVANGDALGFLFSDKDHNERTLRSIMASLGFLVGIGWEKAIEASDETIVIGSHVSSKHPVLAKLSMAIIICLIVLPGWLKYIAPQAKMNDREHLAMMEFSREVKKAARQTSNRVTAETPGLRNPQRTQVIAPSKSGVS